MLFVNFDFLLPTEDCIRFSLYFLRVRSSLWGSLKSPIVYFLRNLLVAHACIPIAGNSEIVKNLLEWKGEYAVELTAIKGNDIKILSYLAPGV